MGQISKLCPSHRVLAVQRVLCEHLLNVDFRVYGCRGWGQGEKEGKGQEFVMDMYTLLYLKWKTNKISLYSTGNSVQCYVAAWVRGQLST